MTTAWALLHLGAAGLWLGCVLTEVLFERALLAGGREQHRLLAQLHWRVDCWVEMPAMAAVLASGLAQWPLWTGGPAAWAMLLAGMLAWLLNAACVVLVRRRLTAAEAGRWTQFDRLDRWQHRLGAGVLLGQITALAAGVLARV